jgi:hypothetical protein
VARGEDRLDSDVDFLARFEPGTTLLDQAGFISSRTECHGADHSRSLLETDESHQSENNVKDGSIPGNLV